MNIFKCPNGQLRNIWWIAIFFIVLAALTFPLILLSQRFNWKITMLHQAVIAVGANWICQLMRKKPFTELIGHINITWAKNFVKGSLVGTALMLIPALFLYLGGWVSWENQSFDFSSLLSVTVIFLCVAVAEEFVFRGFLFQRLIGSIGIFGAQLIMAGYFLLTHLNNPGMTGNIKVFASINIFLASILFGLAFIRSNNLSMPIGLHFMANWVQGTLLGFGVSGNDQSGIFKPVFSSAPQWLTGGSFGLEASVPGLICVIILILALHKWQPSDLDLK